MEMNTLRFIILGFIALLIPQEMMAFYDFKVDGLCYIINPDSTSVFVTCERDNTSPSYDNISSDLVINETVTYNDKIYKITEIGFYAFRYCSNLHSIVLSNSIAYIGAYAFEGCTNLTTVVIPNSLLTIGLDAFYGTPWFNNQPDGLVYAGNVAYKYKGNMPSGTSLVLREGTISISPKCFADNNGLKSITIPNSVSYIGYSAFQNCSSLITINIPNSCDNISNSMLSGCSSLITVDIPNSVAEIGYHAFEGCCNLNSINIPNSVAFIHYKAFKDCCSLTSIEIPSSVKLIREDSFEGCNNITSVFWNAKSCFSNPFETLKASIKHFSFGNEIVTIYKSFCSGMTGLTSVSFENSVKCIEENSFYGCSNLESVKIPNSVTSIGNSAFSGCKNLKKAIIGENVTSIGNKAFYYCSKLEDLVTLRKRPIAIPENTFEGIPTASCDLHVPKGSKERYEYQDVWKEFLYIIDDAEEFAESGANPPSGSGVKGDVTGDGSVDIGDVNAVINIMLGKE